MSAAAGSPAPEFDRGPPAPIARLLQRVPDPPVAEDFWRDWGPVFYRGRLDGSARVLCIASDPGPTERIAGRCLVGNAGQRVQGLLGKLGLTRSYVLVNAWAYALHPARAQAERERLTDAVQLQWRNALYDAVAGPGLQAIIAFGVMAQDAAALWTGRPAAARLHAIPHPSSRNEQELLDRWRAAVADLRGVVTPDPGGDATGPNYGTTFTETDYAAIPRRDLAFGVPAFLGDDAAVRARRGEELRRAPVARRRAHADLARPAGAVTARRPRGLAAPVRRCSRPKGSGSSGPARLGLAQECDRRARRRAPRANAAGRGTTRERASSSPSGAPRRRRPRSPN